MNANIFLALRNGIEFFLFSVLAQTRTKAAFTEGSRVSGLFDIAKFYFRTSIEPEGENNREEGSRWSETEYLQNGFAFQTERTRYTDEYIWRLANPSCGPESTTAINYTRPRRAVGARLL